MNFIKSIISGDNGQGSTHRVCMLATVALLLSWSTRIVILKQAIPDIPETWVWFIGVLVAGITTGKGVDAYKSVKSDATSTPV
jgi:hypothetical protein